VLHLLREYSPFMSTHSCNFIFRSSSDEISVTFTSIYMTVVFSFLLWEGLNLFKNWRRR